MDKKVCVTTLIFLLIPAFPLSAKAIATLYVDPPAVVTSVGDTFSVNITISDVIDLAGWEFKLYYSSAKLNGTNLVEGSFLKQGGSTYFAVINFTDNYNSTHGVAWVTCALLGGSPGVNGNGTLAIVAFEVKQLGTSTLSLIDTWMSDSQPIPHIALGGIVYVLPHDVAITDLIPSKTVVGQGLTVKMDVSILNKGNFTETFNVTVYANSTSITSQTITLTSGNSTTLMCTWNTSGFAYGNHTIKAVADTVPVETDTGDNNLTGGWVIVSLVGDITGPDGWPDGDVDIRDVSAVARLFGVSSPSPEYNPNFDINGDGDIDIKDVSTVARHFGEHV